jgi:hypothetical protein
VIFQKLLVSLIQCLVEMNGKIVFPDFEEKNGKCQLNICWTFMITCIGCKLCMRMFRSGSSCFSLEGIARDWYRSLPYASINSLADFHAAFHVFCKDHFPDDLLYPECCHEFHLLTKDSDVNEEYVAIENTLHYQEIDDSHYDNHCDAFNIVLNASFKDGCDEDPIIHFENLKNDEQIDISAGDNFRSTANTKGSLEFLDL